jgi:hypothetical protein
MKSLEKYVQEKEEEIKKTQTETAKIEAEKREKIYNKTDLIQEMKKDWVSKKNFVVLDELAKEWKIIIKRNRVIMDLSEPFFENIRFKNGYLYADKTYEIID